MPETDPAALELPYTHCTDPDAGEEAAQDGAMCGHTMAVNDARLVCKRPPHGDTDHAAAGWLREADLECGHAVPGLLDGETLTCVRAPHDDEQHRAADGTTWQPQADAEDTLTEHDQRIHRAEQANAALEARVAHLEQELIAASTGAHLARALADDAATVAEVHGARLARHEQRITQLDAGLTTLAETLERQDGGSQ